MELIVNYLFFYIGKFFWIILRKMHLVSEEFGDWGYVALGFVIFLIALIASIFLMGVLYGNE